MAYSFANGVISGDGGYSYDLNPYLKSASTGGGGDTTGGIGALHSFYDNYATNQGGATNPTNAFLGGTQYSPTYSGNTASAIGESLLPQIKAWWEQNYKPPTTTSSNALAPQTPTAPAAPAQPPNPWATQPKPTTEANAATSVPTQTAGNAFQLPAGFDIRRGSTDPNDPTGENQRVYGTNYFPSNDPGFQQILRRYMGWGDEARPPIDKEAFLRMDENAQGLYRQALYEWFQSGGGGGGGGTPLPPGPPAPPAPPEAPRQPFQAPPFGSVGPTPPGPPGFGGGTNAGNSGFPFPGAYTAPPFSYNEVDDFTKNPAYQARLKESERALQAQLLSRGRLDSTGGQNAFATNARRLTGEFEQEAYNRARGENVLNYDRFLGENMTAYDRALTINKMTYDRKYQEDVLGYERQFRENERRYGREMAENILAYERAFREDAREYERVRWLVANGLFGTLTNEG